MPLSEFSYLVFLLGVSALFYALPAGAPRRWMVLSASYLFYVWLSGFYVIALLYVTAVAYTGGLLLRAVRRKAYGQACLILCISGACLPLILFKSGLFMTGHTGWLAPIGISFFTFAALGYLADVYLEMVEPEKDPVSIGLFLAFFPLVTSGPIERAGRLLPQFAMDTGFSQRQAVLACRMLLLGFVLKVVIANQLAAPVNAFFDSPAAYAPLDHLLAMIHYVFYLYSDFAGYSFIAIGSAKLMGLEVNPNFRQPFLSSSIAEFWRRWHISLSSWVRDYIYAPLQAALRRYRAYGTAAALLISFAILGIWHGLEWKFLLFGLMHGLMLVISLFTREMRERLARASGIPPAVFYPMRLLSVFFLVLLTFVMFRASSPGDAMVIYSHIFSVQLLAQMQSVFLTEHSLDALRFGNGVSWTFIAGVIGLDIVLAKQLSFDRMPRIVRIIFYNACVFMLAYRWLASNHIATFEYYRF